MKFVTGLAEVEKNDQEEKNNNAFFALIHPEVKTPISDLLKDKTMTVHKFQKNYLGYYKNKKPVSQPFNSNLVRRIHRITPQLKVSKAHELEDKFMNSSQRKGWTQKNTRSMSQGNTTLSTFNKTMTIFM